MLQHQDLLESNTKFDSESSSESNSDDLDEELIQVCTAIAPASVDATPQELRQALKVTQKLLLNLRGRYQETMKRNTLLELRKIPSELLGGNVNLNSKERWISGVSMEDGVKAELFQFIPAEEHELMNYHSFGSQFGRGVSNAHSEMASDVKACADPGCRALLLSPHGDYTKFVPVLFPTPEMPVPNEMLKSVKLVQVLKVSLFGKSSLAATGAASSRTKAKIWKLWAITPGMIAAAAVIAMFLLSSDTELTEIGETTKIPYRKYHNFFRQRLLTGGPWAHQVFLFFNDALFSISSSVPPSANDDGLGHMYEEEFEHAMEQELEGPVFNAGHLDDVRLPLLNSQTISVPHNSLLSDSEDEAHPPTPLNHPPAAPTVNAAAAPTIVAPPVPAPPIPAPPESISTTMGDLNLGDQDVRLGVEHLSPMEINNACPKPKPKPKPKPWRKAQMADNLVIAEGFTADSTHSAVWSINAQTTRRSG
ncbi:uncharacterized protein EDB91DRAFT_1252742 [Suillus paluster]|uniref:uncharacterized protein n=1 Tax=Suillus paluster TaxID=48578 RepID=UPI001B86B3EF|nr:uncharacterized protein EDB91DRAFT_1252742 [Suillus paluster]KAG1730267.1 hypothetical protein EDB91DRAFT_1252742 [Suillus paluster]